MIRKNHKNFAWIRDVRQWWRPFLTTDTMFSTLVVLTLLLVLAYAQPPEPPSPCPAYIATCPRSRYQTMAALVNVVDPHAVCVTRSQFLALWNVHASPGLRLIHAGDQADQLLDSCFSGPSNDLLCISYMHTTCECIPDCRTQSYADMFVNNVREGIVFG